MAVTQISFHVLCVGQGNGTFVVYYDGKTVVDVAIMDFGSDTSTISDSGKAAVAWATTLLKSMPAKKISATFFSHSDTDHISLMTQLLAEFPKETDPLDIGAVFYGGKYGDYTKGKTEFNILEALEEYSGKESGALPEANTSFVDATATALVTVRDVAYYVLVANVAGNYSPKNSVSLVVVADYPTNQFVMCGDATGATIAKANDVIKNSQAARDHLGWVYHVTVPHHGSYTTAAKCMPLAPDKDWKTIWQDFVSKINPKSASATTGIENTHKHPSAAVLEFVWNSPANVQDKYQDPMLPGTGRHYYTAYFDPARQIGDGPTAWPPVDIAKTWITVQTKAAIFTNDYWTAETDEPKIVPPLPVADAVAVDPPLDAEKRPAEVHWEFRLNIAAKTITVHRIAATSDVLALGAALLAGVRVQDLDIPDWNDLLATARDETPAATFPMAGGDGAGRRPPARA